MRLAIFDVDGTISDSQAHILHAMRFAFAQEAVAAPDRAAILSIVGLSLPEAVARLVPRAADEVGIRDHRRFADVVRAAFGQRRKTLRNALSGTCSVEQIEAAGLRPDLRAEQVPVGDFIRLANQPDAS